MCTCRVCKKTALRAECVKYGTRHYAHFECYLSSGKSLIGLSDWQIERFPFRLLQKYGALTHRIQAMLDKQP